MELVASSKKSAASGLTKLAPVQNSRVVLRLLEKTGSPLANRVWKPSGSALKRSSDPEVFCDCKERSASVACGRAKRRYPPSSAEPLE
jgi:hypothetical protein